MKGCASTCVAGPIGCVFKVTSVWHVGRIGSISESGHGITGPVVDIPIPGRVLQAFEEAISHQMEREEEEEVRTIQLTFKWQRSSTFQLNLLRNRKK